MSLTLAIDFGTSNSLAGAVTDDQKIVSIPLDPHAADSTILRTILYFPHADQAYYGSEAIQQFIENDTSGRLFRSFKTHLPNKSYLGTMIDDRPLPLENMVGLFLLEMRKRAERHFGREADSVVLGRPARYSLDREADVWAEHRMRKAAEFAGFQDVTFVPEPLAAAYEFRKSLENEKLVLVVDLGGGTSDFTLLKLRRGNFVPEDVLAIDGVNKAGDALDAAIMTHRVAQHFGSKARYRMPLSQNILTLPPWLHLRLCQPAHIAHLKEKDTYEFLREVRNRAVRPADKEALDRLFVLMDDQQIYPLFEKIEHSKRDISVKEVACVDFQYPDIDLQAEYGQQDFQTWTAEARSDIFAALDRTLTSAGVTASQVDLVCCTGGTSKVALIQDELQARFGLERMKTSSQFHSVLGGLVEYAAAQKGIAD